MESIVIKYQTVYAADLIELDDCVNKLISERWEPFGSLIYIPEQRAFVQAMVTYQRETLRS